LILNKRRLARNPVKEAAMEKTPVGVLGATGTVGQRFMQLLENHPYFELLELGASAQSAGKTYAEAVEGRWKISAAIPDKFKSMKVKDCDPSQMECRLVFSALDSSIAGPVEEAFAASGFAVCSNSRNHRMDPDVPILVPEVNSHHIRIIEVQKKKRSSKGFIVTNPNCTLMAFTIPFKPIRDAFGIREAVVVSMQAISGAGYPGVPSLDILGNVIPYIGGEEEKVETEPLKILGEIEGDAIRPASFPISAHCNRVPVVDGHTVCVSIKVDKKPSIEEFIEALRSFKSLPRELGLPSAPKRPIIVREEADRPQPRLDIEEERGMASVVGRVRPCPVLDFKFACLSHNTIRGAAGASVLNAEILLRQGCLD
jgi:aspartate-semialdehyde dehydrogenase